MFGFFAARGNRQKRPPVVVKLAGDFRTFKRRLSDGFSRSRLTAEMLLRFYKGEDGTRIYTLKVKYAQKQ